MYKKEPGVKFLSFFLSFCPFVLFPIFKAISSLPLYVFISILSSCLLCPQADSMDKCTEGKNGRMNAMTEDNCRIGDPKVMTNTKGASRSDNRQKYLRHFNLTTVSLSDVSLLLLPQRMGERLFAGTVGDLLQQGRQTAPAAEKGRRATCRWSTPCSLWSQRAFPLLSDYPEWEF